MAGPRPSVVDPADAEVPAELAVCRPAEGAPEAAGARRGERPAKAARSRSIRSISSGGGSTNFGSTVNRWTANFRATTRSSVMASSFPPSAPEASTRRSAPPAPPRDRRRGAPSSRLPTAREGSGARRPPGPGTRGARAVTATTTTLPCGAPRRRQRYRERRGGEDRQEERAGHHGAKTSARPTGGRRGVWPRPEGRPPSRIGTGPSGGATRRVRRRRTARRAWRRPARPSPR